MKKLQSNFTTPYQSKRLLKLGVPADSADCYTIINNDVYNKDEIRVRQNEYEINYSFFNNKHYNPCWSVDRLIEIYGIVGENAGQCVTTPKGTSRIENLVILYEENATLLDFSKLEEV